MISGKAIGTSIIALMLLCVSDVVSARFLSNDPKPFTASNVQTFNRYAYGNNNPYKYVDPDGREAGQPFPTVRAAAHDAVVSINPKSISENKEYVGMIYKNPADGKFYATEPLQGSGTTGKPSLPPNGLGSEARYHTHGNYSVKGKDGQPVATGDAKSDAYNSDHPSSTDKSSGQAFQKMYAPWKEYLGTPSGTVIEYHPATGQEIIVTDENKNDGASNKSDEVK